MHTRTLLTRLNTFYFMYMSDIELYIWYFIHLHVT